MGERPLAAYSLCGRSLSAEALDGHWHVAADADRMIRRGAAVSVKPRPVFPEACRASPCPTPGIRPLPNLISAYGRADDLAGGFTGPGGKLLLQCLGIVLGGHVVLKFVHDVLNRLEALRLFYQLARERGIQLLCCSRRSSWGFRASRPAATAA